MTTVLYILLLIVCFVVLVKGADFLVEGASDIARVLKIPAVIIGLTIVAFGTSAPEAGVSITSSVRGMNTLSISNVVGSNLFNLLVVVGLYAAIHAFPVDSEIRKRDYPLCILFSIFLMVFSLDKQISRIEGVILFAMIVGYIILLVFDSLRSAKSLEEVPEEIKGKDRPVTPKRVFLDILIVVISIGAIYLSSQGIIKLVTSIVASRKGENSIAIGNVVGSNVFNILFVLGLSAAISPVSGLTFANVCDTIVCLAVTCFCFLFVWFGKRFSRASGVIMLLIYAAYMVFVFLREFEIIVIN